MRKFHVRVEGIVLEPVVVDELFTTTANVDTCAIIYDRDTDFGSVAVVDPPVSDPNKLEQLLPSQKIDPSKLEHLSEQQRCELVALLDQFPQCFSKLQGFVILHSMKFPSPVSLSRKDSVLTRFQNG